MGVVRRLSVFLGGMDGTAGPPGTPRPLVLTGVIAGIGLARNVDGVCGGAPLSGVDVLGPRGGGGGVERLRTSSGAGKVSAPCWRRDMALAARGVGIGRCAEEFVPGSCDDASVGAGGISGTTLDGLRTFERRSAVGGGSSPSCSRCTFDASEGMAAPLAAPVDPPLPPPRLPAGRAPPLPPRMAPRVAAPPPRVVAVVGVFALSTYESPSSSTP